MYKTLYFIITLLKKLIHTHKIPIRIYENLLDSIRFSKQSSPIGSLGMERSVKKPIFIFDSQFFQFNSLKLIQKINFSISSKQNLRFLKFCIVMIFIFKLNQLKLMS